ncbi:MAG: endopeptidase La [Flavobacteriales bacterium]|nr:endopeptidase La [Flavobacteriales bacterium]MDG1933474.1 endopeptidase La [Flavobacteriales bacterium]MDG2085707.1 endopeptidase La [Flavobacteriales bacterium]|tara:strand:- start:23 stop:2476 length:2454 start_codon:yes stop_codon:yes gene_type:complete
MKKQIGIKSLNLTDLLNEETEFLPLMSDEDEAKISKEDAPDVIPILPLRNTVLFPGVIIPITIGRDRSIRLIKDAEKGNKMIGVVAQKDFDTELPDKDDLHKVGTIANILKMLKMPDGNITVVIQGRKRFNIDEMMQNEPYFKAKITELKEIKPMANDEEFSALVSSVKELSLKIIDLSPNIPSEAAIAIKNIKNSSFIINFVSSNMNISLSDKQLLLEEIDLKKRAISALELLTKELQMQEMKNKIQSKVQTDLDQQQKEYFLNQQMKAIQEELGGNGSQKEIDEMRLLASKKKWNEDIGIAFDKELKKLQRMNPSMSDYAVQRSYIELILELPWNDVTKDKFNLDKARDILDRDHFGLEQVKERIIEHLAVLKLKGDMKSPILCLYGPPGVGKTSLGKSIAESLKRNYERVSLGGLRDEAEIRGHRKTYIGAMPGRIIKSIKKAKSSNPVFVLDEIDKVARDNHGDPSSALLEVLDPEQNETFHDNYLDLDYDLSKVMFVATANSLSTIQPALRDRMEIIEMNGYTIEEKVQIAQKHLLPKQLKLHGIEKTQFTLENKIIEKVADQYTRESGVRTLDKMISKLIRNVAKSIAMNQKYSHSPSSNEIEKVLGAPKFDRERVSDNSVAGVVTGLAWTSVGGDILFIESSLSRGKGKLSVTGNLGVVMKESITIAMEYLKSHALSYNLDFNVFEKWNVHVHVPEGATPKDGPSAGITMFTSLVSSFTQRKVKEKIAMTGELTLRGKVLPVGGIKEKILAAKRSGIREIILSKQNKKDILEINAKYIKGLTFHYVDKLNEVIDIALLSEKVDNFVEINV